MLFYSKILPVTKMIPGIKYGDKIRLNACFNEMAPMKWRHLGHLQLLSRAVAVMAEMEVSLQEEITNPQGMKVFAVERHGLPEDFVSLPALCGVQSSPLVFVLNRSIVWGPLQQW